MSSNPNINLPSIVTRDWVVYRDWQHCLSLAPWPGIGRKGFQENAGLLF
ncbi:MAG: hypothetical protein HN758_12335 [Verrucomicrobia bacterium]|nr:hypothetical protein [Verrucomicrobiota bacterium]MBT4275020.1 hypothetical protein [Verrucomicrobiota bacterium]MBT5063504.1 hypothetical protein [Verrucomicrobiota bacterium]MBT5477598.1 hypothetical protein [Verrucomicrobiota bacterium]MBT6237774.1 hypothetical protein [Verrucomicrobiota bacterium]